ncbi:MAG: class I SAM-dependent RNA methyltransferase, partial [Gemmatimonadales bacterium]
MPLAYDCYAIIAPGLEAITARELAVLGFTPKNTEPGGITFDATAIQLYAANLHLRTASRVLVRVAEFGARTFFELERHARKIPWERFVVPGGAIAFRVTSRKSKLYHDGAIEE